MYTQNIPNKKKTKKEELPEEEIQDQDEDLGLDDLDYNEESSGFEDDDFRYFDDLDYEDEEDIYN